MKKYFIFAAAAIVAMCACTKNELDSNIADQEISFQVANFVNQTKALPEGGSAYYADGHFGTFAWQMAEGSAWSTTSTTGQTTFMDNVKIKNQSNVWKAEKSYYWPKTGSVTFASYSPFITTKATPAATDTVAVANATTGAITISNWTVKTDESAQAKNYTDDLMWATIAADKKANNTTYVTSGVPTLFHHALAKVTLNAVVKETPSTSAYDYKVIINNISVSNLLYKGSYTSGATSGTWTPTTDRAGDDAIFSQSYTKPAVGATYADPSDTKVLSTTAGTYFANYFVLPQTLDATSTIKINYTIFTLEKNTNKVVLVETLDSYKLVEDAAGTIEVKDKKYKKADIKISDMGLTAWAENQDITYTVTLVPTGGSGDNPDFVEIYFDPAVAAWSPVTQASPINF